MIAWWDEDVWVLSKKGPSAGERKFIKESRSYNAVKSRRRQKRYGWIAVIAALIFVIGASAFIVLGGASGIESASVLITVVCLTMGGLMFGVSYASWWLDERSYNNQTEVILKRLATDPNLTLIDESYPFWSALTTSRGWQTYAKEMRRQSQAGVILSGMIESALADQVKATEATPGSRFCDAYRLAEAMDRELRCLQAATPPK